MPRRTRRVRGRRRGIKSRRIAGVGSPKKTNNELNTDVTSFTDLTSLLDVITDVAAEAKKKAEREYAELSKQVKPIGSRKSNRSNVLFRRIEKTKKKKKDLDNLIDAIKKYDNASRGASQINLQKGNNTFGMNEMRASLELPSE